MRQTRILGVAVAVLAMAVAVSPALAAKAKKAHPVRGVVEKVETTKDGKKKITIMTADHKNKKTGEVTKGGEKTFTVTDTTTFAQATSKKDTNPAPTVTFADLKEGMHVAITATDDMAVSVKIAHHHHGKKKKPVA